MNFISNKRALSEKSVTLLEPTLGNDEVNSTDVIKQSQKI